MVIQPIDTEIARTILLVGMFVPQSEGSKVFERGIPEEGTLVTATIQPEALHIQITPAISMMAHHSDKRLAASVYFEIAASYAMHVDGTITQLSNIGACVADGVQSKVLARYPNEPMNMEKICVGFQEVLAGGHIHEDYDSEPIAY